MSKPNSDDLADALAKLVAGDELDVTTDDLSPTQTSDSGAGPRTVNRAADPLGTLPPPPMPSELPPPPPPVPLQPIRKSLVPPAEDSSEADLDESTSEQSSDPDDQPPDEASPDEQSLDELDTLVPAPDADAFMPRPLSAAGQRAAGYQTLAFRRTAIPILLVCGCLLLIFAAAAISAPGPSPLSTVPQWLVGLMLIMGLLLLALATMNILSVHERLRTIKQR